MPTSKLRVIPTYRGRGMIGLAAMLGMVAGLALELSQDAALRSGAMLGLAGMTLSLVLILASIFVPGIVFAVAITQVTSRTSRVVLLGAVFWSAMSVSADATMFALQARAGTATFAVRLLWMVGVECIAAALIGATVSWLVSAIVRRAWFRAVEQDGLWCWMCAYRIGSPWITVCPECGTPIDATRFRWNWVHRAMGAGRRLGWAGLIALAAVGGAAILAQMPRVRNATRFETSMRRFGTIIGVSIVPPGTTPFSFGPGCLGASLPLNPSASLDLLVAYNPERKQGGPVMLVLTPEPGPA